MKKRLLSVALVFSMLASLLMIGITGPVSAVKTTSSIQDLLYDGTMDLSKELTPDVSLTFEEGSYGLPFGRYHSAVYNDGYATITNNNGWIYFGNEASKSVSTTKRQDASSANDKYVSDYLYYFEAGKRYCVTVDYNFLKGSTITDRTLVFRLAENPNQAVGEDSFFASKSFSGNTVEWKVNGVEQTGTLEANTDMQTATVIFDVATSGYLGIFNFVNNDSEGNPIPATMAIDSVKIYNLTALCNSTFQNKITFEDNAGGVGAIRYNDPAEYATEANGNRYGVLKINGNNSVYLANTEYSPTYRMTKALDFSDAEKCAETDAFYNSYLFKFLPGKRYEVSFKYRYPEGSGVAAGTELKFKLMADPLGQAHSADNLTASGTTWAKDVEFEGNKLTSGVGVWQECKVTFTVKTLKEVSEAGYANVRTNANGGYAFNGAHFGFLGVTSGILHIDDYEVKQLTESKHIYVSHDMEEDDFTTNATGTPNNTLVANSNESTYATTGAKIVDSGDEKYGNVAQLDGNGSRFTAVDTGVFVKGRKYYVSFDAKSTSGEAQEMWLSFGDIAFNNCNFGGSQNTATRVVFKEEYKVLKSLKFYVNGIEISSYDNDFKLSTEWQHFGIIIDFTDANVVAAFEGKNPDIFDSPRCFFVGVANSWYDNLKITAVNAMDDAIPTSNISYISKEISHDMESYDEIFESVDGAAHIVNSFDEKYGQVMEITASESTTAERTAFSDSNIITSGKKYYISFDAKTTVNRERFMWLSISGKNSGIPSRFIISDNIHHGDKKGATDLEIAENGNAFKYYINGEEVIRDDFKLSGDWRKYTLVIDTSDPDLLAKAASDSGDGQISGLFNTARYFYFGCEDTWFDNFRMVEVSETTEAISKENAVYDTEVSFRSESTAVNGEYISAGLRFKTKLPSGMVAEADEIGFVAAPSSMAKDTDGWYKLENGVNDIARAALVKDNIRNYVYATEGDDTYYQLVFTGLSTEDDKTAYNVRFSAVLYVKNGEEYSYYPLGETSYNHAMGIKNFFGFNEEKLDVSTMASKNYKVVYNADEYNTWVVKNQITKLQQALNNKSFGIEDSEVGADVDLTVSDYEIVIGNTSRGTVGDVSALSNINNYAIRISDSKVYVMAGSTYALQSAIYELETMVLAGTITEKEGSYLDTAVIDSTSEYKLVWQSEFDDPHTVTYDSSNLASIKNWYVDPITVNADPNQGSIYNSQAFLVSDSETVLWDDRGYLILRAVRKDDSELPWESDTAWSENTNLKYKQQGGIKSETMKFNGGYLEMRARIPDGNGIRSSFWLESNYNGKTPHTEIDIFESHGEQGRLQANVHWWGVNTVANNLSDDHPNKPFLTALSGIAGHISFDNAWELSKSSNRNTPWYLNYEAYNKYYQFSSSRNTTLAAGDLYNNWHTIGLLWTDKVLEFYCDGKIYCKQDVTGFTYPDGTYAFANQFVKIIGGFNLGWNGREDKIDESTMTWDDGYLNYVIDYFRLYQIVDGDTNSNLKLS